VPIGLSVCVTSCSCNAGYHHPERRRSSCGKTMWGTLDGGYQRKANTSWNSYGPPPRVAVLAANLNP
jgi:hypothetical protein